MGLEEEDQDTLVHDVDVVVEQVEETLGLVDVGLNDSIKHDWIEALRVRRVDDAAMPSPKQLLAQLTPERRNQPLMRSSRSTASASS